MTWGCLIPFQMTYASVHGIHSLTLRRLEVLSASYYSAAKKSGCKGKTGVQAECFMEIGAASEQDDP